MKSVAVYSLKGGVGKTTLAVNLAWASAIHSSRRTLLWDLDPQAAASFLLDGEARGAREARALFEKAVSATKLIRPTRTERLSLIAADRSLRGLDHFLHELGKKKRLGKLLDDIGRNFDVVVLDCPPGLTALGEQVLRGVDLVVVPLIPSPLSRRALHEVIEYLDGRKAGARILPVYNMVDRRRSLHAAELGRHTGWPAVPMCSTFERMSVDLQPVSRIAPRSPAARAASTLWQQVERCLATG